MKNILFLFFLLPAVVIGQTIPKGSTKIIVKNDLTAKENYDLAVKTLMDNDYIIEARDGELMTIKTQPTKVNKWTGLTFINVRAKDNEIQFSGMFKTGIGINSGGVTINDEYEPLAYKGSKGSLFRTSFENIDKIASKITGTKTYQ